MRERTRLCVEELKRQGLQFDSDKRVLKAIPGANCPRKFINEVIVHLWEEIVPEYRARTGDKDAIAPEGLRYWIYWRLCTFFPFDMIDPARKGPIDRAIRNHLK